MNSNKKIHGIIQFKNFFLDINEIICKLINFCLKHNTIKYFYYHLTAYFVEQVIREFNRLKLQNKVVYKSVNCEKIK